MKSLPFSALMIFALVMPLAAEAADVREITGFSLPESIASDGRYVYVSNMGEKLDPAAKDQDGFISRLSLDGRVLDRHFLPKSGNLSSPKGIAVNGRRLYVADVDQLLAFDLDSGALLLTLDFSAQGTHFLNDIAVKDKDTLFVSATDLGRIYQVDVGKQPAYRALDLEIKGPNGLYYVDKTLYVAGFGANNQPNGQLGLIRFRGKKTEYQLLSDAQGYFDGLAVTASGDMLFSDWVAFEKQGLIKRRDAKTSAISELPMPDKLAGPADFLLDEQRATLWIPEMMAGKIHIQKLPGL